MADRPNPDGWQGGSEDFQFVRTFDGHRGIGSDTPPDKASDPDWRRNAKSFDEADLGGEYDI